ncbi:MAG: hypothetical protein OIF51_06400 [Cellvibrionaceae bacterium]|nr:hypothetical protein [Cellvibrionaceae bacterium]
MEINSSNKGATNSPLPHHPFFSQSSNPATLTDCLDAIDRANAVIELINSLELSEQNGGLSERALFGYYWVNSLVQSALTFVNVRLNELQLESNKQLHSQSLVTGLFQALESMDKPHQDQFLRPVARHMGMETSELLDTLKDISSRSTRPPLDK